MTNPQSSESGAPAPRPVARLLWQSLLAGAGIALLLVPVLTLKFGSGKEDPSLLFLGRFHPLVVHLPIGLLLLAILFEFLAKIRPFRHLRDSISAILLIAAVGAGLAVVHGCLLAAGGGDFSPAMKQHLWAGVSVAVGAFLLLPLRAATVGFGSWLWSLCYHAVLIATVLAMAVTGHLGGNLTHGSDYLVKHMPPGLRSTLAVLPKPVREFLDLPEAPAAPSPAEATIYTALLAPAFDKHCVSCHNDKKTKGGLRLDSVALMLKGGDTGPGISPGKPKESEVIHRITLPADDDDFMPPDGKPPLSKQEVAAIQWWVESGKPAETPLASINDAPVEIKAFLDKAAQELAASAGPGPAATGAATPRAEAGLPADTIETFNTSGPGRVQPISRDPKDGLILINAGTGPAFNDEALTRIAPVASLLREIDLSRTGVTDQGLALVAKCPDLRKLRLDQTKIGSPGVASLLPLRKLETLNLFGTGVDDTAIDHLVQLKTLKALYLGETKVTQEGLKKLQAALPECRVVGVEAPPASPPAAPAPKG